MLIAVLIAQNSRIVAQTTTVTPTTPRYALHVLSGLTFCSSLVANRKTSLTDVSVCRHAFILDPTAGRLEVKMSTILLLECLSV